MVKYKFSHLAITCNNPRIIEDFYSKHFSFTRVHTFNPGPQEIIMLKSADLSLELFKTTQSPSSSTFSKTGPEHPGLKHLCFKVDDLEEKLQEMGKEAKITYGPLILDDMIPGMRACWIADPEGNIIELNEGYKD